MIKSPGWLPEEIDTARPADWSSGMTICIAAMADNEDAIVFTSDMMISTDHFTADSLAIKFVSLSQDWQVMFSGSDVTQIPLIADRARELLEDYEDKQSLGAVAGALKTAYQEQVKERATDLVLARYGVSMQAFLRDGPNSFGENAFTALKYQIDAIDLGCTFLGCGYDAKRKPHIFSIESPGETCSHNIMGFWAIGSGSNRALSSLFAQGYSRFSALWKCIYCVSEAKFMAESAGGIGKNTVTFVLYKSGGYTYCVGGSKKLRDFWEANGRPRIPNGTEEMVQTVLKEDFSSYTPPVTEKSADAIKV